ncbi:hypothetical protein V5R04_06780 [Jonesiaceae bacterium BS-20]|uniref:Uncharacterized protein n=1 Tax=Jonesiaceae bacterium BS-20 TaxID=3120821 RepID=A0AAU7DYU7_9MICO
MGAEYFRQQVATTASASDTYDMLVDGARHEFGYDSYNGSISTTEGIKALNIKPMPLDDAIRLAESRYDSLAKRECEAIPFLKETKAMRDAVQVVNVTLDLKESELQDQTSLLAAIRKAGKFGKDLEITEFHRTNVQEVIPRVTVSVPRETTETLYFIMGPRISMMPKWDKGYPTQAAARAALDAAARQELTYSCPITGESSFEVIAITRRSSGKALLSAKATVRNLVQATFSVSTRKVLTPAEMGTELGGWVIHGWGAS